jgi:acetyl esterase/lipase
MKTNKPTCLLILALLKMLLSSFLVGCGEQTSNIKDRSETETPIVSVAIDMIAERPILEPGECTLIEWNVQGGFGVELNGEIVDPAGQKTVCPEETTIYQITVDAGDRLEQAELQIFIEIDGEEEAVEVVEQSGAEFTGVESSSFEVIYQRDLVYGTYTTDKQSHNLLLDLYLPKVSDVQPIPVIVFIHGGGWFEGSRDTCPGNTFAVRGYAVACVEYRLAKIDGCPPDYSFPVQLYDIKAAVRWLRLNSSTYGLDSNKIAAMGASSGGHLAALLGTSHGIQAFEGEQNTGASDAVQAVVDWYGPVDIINGPQIFSDDPCTTPLETLNQVYGGEETQYFYWTLAWGIFLGGSLEEQHVLDQATEASPLTHIDPSDPPFLILHGENDGMVPVNQSKMLKDALLAAGVDVTFIILPNASHNYGSPEAEVSDDFLLPTINFLDEHLRR